MNAFERSLQFQRQTTARTAAEFFAVDRGYVARSPSMPEVWSANHLRLTGQVAFDELVALADEHLSALPYRQVSLEDDHAGRLLENELREAGWKTEREVVMELRRPADRPADTSGVIEAGEEEMLALMRRWHMEGQEQISEAGLRQLHEFGRRENRAWGDRTFAIRGEDGGLAAMTRLRVGGGVAQIEDVFVAPESRGRGYGRAVISHATELARHGDHELRFIIADDNDWPKTLYAKLGFDPIGWTWSFHQSRP